MAHPDRELLVSRLNKQLDTNVTVVWDQKNDVWDTGRRALLNYKPGSTHHLVLQDDTIIAKNLIGSCRRLLQRVPADAPVSLYIGKNRTKPIKYPMSPLIQLGRRRRSSFAVFDGPWWGPGIIVPTHLIEDIIRFGDENPEITQYDHKISWFFVNKGIKCFYTLPSLVDHNPVEAESLLGHGNGQGRKSGWFIGSNKSASLISWTPRIVTPSDLPKKLHETFPPSPNYQQRVIEPPPPKHPKPPAISNLKTVTILKSSLSQPPKTRIPSTIHQIWVGPNKVPYRWINTWKKNHPGWTYKLWTEKDLRDLDWLPKNLELYAKYILQGRYHGAANVLRVEILYKYGGVYLDADLKCINPITGADFMDADFWVSESANQRKRPANGAMGTIPKGRIITRYRDLLTKVTEIHPSWKRTGALLLAKSMNQVGRRGHDIIVPSESWYSKDLKGKSHRVGWNGPIYSDHFGYSTKKNSVLRRRGLIR